MKYQQWQVPKFADCWGLCLLAQGSSPGEPMASQVWFFWAPFRTSSLTFIHKSINIPIYIHEWIHSIYTEMERRRRSRREAFCSTHLKSQGILPVGKRFLYCPILTLKRGRFPQPRKVTLQEVAADMAGVLQAYTIGKGGPEATDPSIRARPPTLQSVADITPQMYLL